MSVLAGRRAGDEEKAFDTDQESRYEPIHHGIRDNLQEPSQVNSRLSTPRPSSTVSSITRVRSQNGHGCADLEESRWPDGEPPEGRAVAEKDSFEVSWDSEDEPMCPRSLSFCRKWMIVVIVSMGSLCV